MERLRIRYPMLFSSCVLAALFPLTGLVRAGNAKVNLVRTPDGGIQPQAVVDGKGVLHLIYLKGDPEAGDIFYVRREPGELDFSKPLRVNSQPGSAIAVGSVRGPQLAIGKDGRVHAAWMGSRVAEPRGPGGATPMLYTRLNDQANAFEPQRNIIQFAAGLDGGGSVAADGRGNVYVAWHARGEIPGEAHRRIYVARSSDEGRTFAREVPADPGTTGACGCCGMRAFADRGGTLYILYRAATQNVHRDMVLLVSRDGGKGFQATRVHNWELNACPMSTASIKQAGAHVLAAWETAGQVFYEQISPPTLRPIPAPGKGGTRKHPVVAGNQQGETLLAWTAGTGWKQGGSLDWQLFDKDGHAVGTEGHAGGVPVWGLVAATVNPDGGFTIVY